jgi:hypothetical protein
MAERGDSNPRDPFESTRVPGVRLKPGSATSPRETRLCITPPRGATCATAATLPRILSAAIACQRSRS